MRKITVFTALLMAPFMALFSVYAAAPLEARIQAFEAGLQSEGNRSNITERMAHYNVPGISIAVIEDGKIAWAKGYGVKLAGTKDAVDTDTMFSVGSLSKVGAAATTLRYVDAGNLDLDRNINTYLKRWKLPENELTKHSPVTMRRILSHTAGLTVHGFEDYQADDDLPTVFDTLDGVGTAKNSAVRVDIVPGSKYRYSGGGTTIEQLVIEEISGLSFPQAVYERVFMPLGMKRSSYQNPLPNSYGNKARAHDKNGQYDGWEAMPETAASGFWTTPTDYAKMIIAFIKSYRGEENSFLSKPLARDMMTEVSPASVGLGPRLGGEGETRRFSHGGSNQSYKAYMEGHLATGNGVVIFTNGAQGSALIKEVYFSLARAEGWPTKSAQGL